MTSRMIVGLAIAALVWPAAMPRAQDFNSFRVMSPPLALAMAQAALKTCGERGFQVAVAVVDRFGIPQVMLRDSLAGAHTPDTAIAKARTAVSFRSSTQDLAVATQAGQLNSAIRHIPGYVFFGGGAPVEAAGSIVGGIGISGAPGGPDDDACAQAGIAAVEERLLM